LAEQIIINTSDKESIYKELMPQLRALLEGEYDLIANMANFCGAYKEAFHILWVGFYVVKGNELVLGPYQGPIACTRIQKGKGVCGTSWKKKETIIVPDVDAFEGHISCSSLSKSEIVVPLFNKKKEVIAVLDIDSSEMNTFDTTDQKFLEEMVQLIRF